VLERACVMATSPIVDIDDALPVAIIADRRPSHSHSHVATLDDNERAHIRRALAATNGRIHGPRGAANILDINPSTLRSRMEKLGIEAA
jgi:formate hydrogenlyase transcriptional activator